GASADQPEARRRTDQQFKPRSASQLCSHTHGAAAIARACVGSIRRRIERLGKCADCGAAGSTDCNARAAYRGDRFAADGCGAARWTGHRGLTAIDGLAALFLTFGTSIGPHFESDLGFT